MSACEQGGDVEAKHFHWNKPISKTMVCNCLQLENLKLIQKPNQSIMAATPNQTNPLNFPTYFHTNHVGLNKKPN